MPTGCSLPMPRRCRMRRRRSRAASDTRIGLAAPGLPDCVSPLVPPALRPLAGQPPFRSAEAYQRPSPTQHVWPPGAPSVGGSCGSCPAVQREMQYACCVDDNDGGLRDDGKHAQRNVAEGDRVHDAARRNQHRPHPSPHPTLLKPATVDARRWDPKSGVGQADPTDAVPSGDSFACMYATSDPGT